MFNISNYFGRLSKIEEKTKEKQDLIREIITKITGISGVSYDVKKGVLYIKNAPVAKNIVFIKKTKILEEFKKNDITKNISDIR